MDNSTILGLIGTSVGALLLFVLRMVLKSSKYEQILRAGLPIAYAVVSNFAAKTDTKVDDQIAMFLKALNDWLVAHEQPELNAAGEAKAKAVFAALTGAGK